jgi:hypothetical protein
MKALAQCRGLRMLPIDRFPPLFSVRSSAANASLRVFAWSCCYYCRVAVHRPRTGAAPLCTLAPGLFRVGLRSALGMRANRQSAL